jgi:hypothetical protein
MRAHLAGFLCAIALAAFGRLSAAEEKAPTCVEVEASADVQPGLSRLVADEVDRHPTHRAARTDCTTHLRVELIPIGSDRFLTGRTDGEVPDRVRVDGADAAALERAVTDLLRTVLGSDPVTLKAPGGSSWLGDRAFALRHDAHGLVELAPLETMAFLPTRLSFAPGLLVGYVREIADVEVGIEAIGSQNLARHPGKLELDTILRLEAKVAYYFSSEADVAGFAALALGIGHQRFSGPVAPDVGHGDATYAVTGPAIALRCGVELFRTTSTRGLVFAEAFVPIFWADDRENGVFRGWAPSISVGAGARF